MSQDLANLLQQTLTTELPHLRAVTEEQASQQPPRSGAWSKKEELGHLIDSAINNHARFVRIALEETTIGVLHTHRTAGSPFTHIATSPGPH